MSKNYLDPALTDFQLQQVDKLFADRKRVWEELTRWRAVETPTARDLQIQRQELKRLEPEWAQLEELLHVMRGDFPDLDGVAAATAIERVPLASRQQEQRILSVLVSLGFNPLNLPVVGPKAAAWKNVQATPADRRLIRSYNVFKKAWDRLRADKLIVSSPKLGDT